MFIRRSSSCLMAHCGAHLSIILIALLSFLYQINAMSLDRLSLNYNDIKQNDKTQHLQLNNNDNDKDYNENVSSLNSENIVYDNTQYSPVDLNDPNNNLYTLITINRNNEDDDNFISETKAVKPYDGIKSNDMLMLESQSDRPVVEIIQLPGTLNPINDGIVKDAKDKDESDNNESIIVNSDKSDDDVMQSQQIKYDVVNQETEDDGKELPDRDNNNDREAVQYEPDNLLSAGSLENQTVDVPMIGVAQEENASEVAEESLMSLEPHTERNEVSSVNNEKENLSQKYSDMQKIDHNDSSDLKKQEISASEDYASTEEDMPEECGEEYYMNPNLETSEDNIENVSDSKKSSDSIEEISQIDHNSEKNENNLVNIGQNIRIELQETTNIPLEITPNEESIQLMEETTKPLSASIDIIVDKDTTVNMPTQPTKEEHPEEKGEISEMSPIHSENMESGNVNVTYAVSSSIYEKQNLSEPIQSTYQSKLRRYDGAQVWRILVQNDRERKLADELNIKYGGQLWKEIKQEVDYMLKPQVLAEAEKYIRGVNLSRIVLIDNLQKVIEVENPPAEQIAQLQNRKGHRLTWQAYHRLEDIHGFLDYLAKTYSDICCTEIIGYSIEKRPLKILKISNGAANNTGIWIDGGIHAREWISPAVVTYVANQLVEGWDDLPFYMKNIDWYIHPVINPDGYEYSHTTDRLWRKNMRSHGRLCPGVDLNRNFGYMWGGQGTSANPCSQIYRGPKAFSEPESFYVSKFISSYPKGTFAAYLSFHSYGQYILYPWGYDYLETNDTMDLDLLARQAGTSIAKSTGVKYTVGASANTLYAASGASDDWAKGIAEIKYTYTIEMGDTGRYGFVLPATEIESNGKNAYTVVQTISRGIKMGKNARRRKLKRRYN